MSNQFEWQTEEEGAWVDEDLAAGSGTAVAPNRPWRTIILIIILLAAAGGIVYWQFNQRLETATIEVEQDVLSSHNLLNRAVYQQDVELMTPLLSGRDMSWTRAQEGLVEAGIYYDRLPLGMSLADADEPYVDMFVGDNRFIDMTLSPDLTAAELQFAQDYDVPVDAETTTTVTLQQTAVYRLGQSRWLLAPPEPDFWGDWETLETELITFVFPERDAELAQELAADLADLVADFCEETLQELSCPNDLRIQLRFDTDLGSLLETADPANLYQGNLRLDFPTPTLVGLPVDNAGYKALYRGYAAQLVRALMADLVAYDCCEHAAFFQAVLDYQLAELELRPWPVTPEIYREVVNGSANLGAVFSLWMSDSFTVLEEEDGWQVYAFVDFLMNQYASSVSAELLLSALVEYPSVRAWLSGTLESAAEVDVFFRDSMSQDWWFYAQAQLSASQGPRPVPFPRQDIALICMNSADSELESTSSLNRYQLDSETWEEPFSYNGLVFMNPLPGDDGMILQHIDFVGENWQTQVWRDGAGVDLSIDGGSFTISLGQMDPQGRYLLIYSGEHIEDELVPYLIDLESCQDGACQVIDLETSPIWSPNGRRTLLTPDDIFSSALYRTDGRISLLNPINEFSTSLLQLGDEMGQPLSEQTMRPDMEGAGYPFWVSNDQYGYIRLVEETTDAFSQRQELVLASVDGTSVEVLLDNEALRQALPDAVAPSRVNILYALPHPQDTSQLVVLAVTRSFLGRLFQVDISSGNIQFLMSVGLEQGTHSIGFSPDGRFLVVTGSAAVGWSASQPPPGNLGSLEVYDFEDHTSESFLTTTTSFSPFYTFDWSADGNWLALVLNRGVLALMAPEYDYQQILLHDFGDCQSLAWVNMTE